VATRHLSRVAVENQVRGGGLRLGYTRHFGGGPCYFNRLITGKAGRVEGVEKGTSGKAHVEWLERAGSFQEG